MGGRLFLTDGGIETWLIYDRGWELPHFAAFHLLRTPDGEMAILDYYRAYAEIARRHAVGLILESATWRASRDWADRLGYSRLELAEANRRAIHLLARVRTEYATPASPIVISGCVGPRGDGYVPGQVMSPGDARAYHREQIRSLSEAGADMVCALTMNYRDEAIGVARAARDEHLPVALSFTVETDGYLPTGQPLRDAIGEVDDATGGYPAYYMINCAHPSHFQHLLTSAEPWTHRIRGVRANASRKSHQELNESTELDGGDPHELADDYVRLKHGHPPLNVLGGCCGTDHRHLARIAQVCAPLF